MDDIVGAGVSALHPIEPKGLNIKELKEKRGHQLCLCGGIDLDLLARVTPEEIKTLVRNILAVAAPGGGYCAGSSNSITEYVKVENYLAMLETVIIEGKY
jgi:uroporphyrinogen decarboxylase